MIQTWTSKSCHFLLASAVASFSAFLSFVTALLAWLSFACSRTSARASCAASAAAAPTAAASGVTIPATPATRAPATPDTPAAGAGALPLANYDQLSLASLRARLRVLDAAQVSLLLDYEKAHESRPDVVTMFERRIAKLNAGS